MCEKEENLESVKQDLNTLKIIHSWMLNNLEKVQNRYIFDENFIIELADLKWYQFFTLKKRTLKHLRTLKIKDDYQVFR